MQNMSLALAIVVLLARVVLLWGPMSIDDVIDLP